MSLQTLDKDWDLVIEPPKGWMALHLRDLWKYRDLVGFVSGAPGLKPLPPGRYLARCEVPANIMNEGSFTIGVAATTYFGDRYVINFFEQGLLIITIRDPKVPNEFNNGYAQTVPGILRPRFDWQVERV